MLKIRPSADMFFRAIDSPVVNLIYELLLTCTLFLWKNLATANYKFSLKKLLLKVEEQRVHSIYKLLLVTSATKPA